MRSRGLTGGRDVGGEYRDRERDIEAGETRLEARSRGGYRVIQEARASGTNADRERRLKPGVASQSSGKGHRWGGLGNEKGERRMRE